jgi:hypothetical protein
VCGTAASASAAAPRGSAGKGLISFRSSRLSPLGMCLEHIPSTLPPGMSRSSLTSPVFLNCVRQCPSP